MHRIAAALLIMTPPPQTFTALRSRIAETLAALETIQPAEVEAFVGRDMRGFIRQLVVFAELAAVLLVLNVSQVWLNQTSRVVLRQGLVHDLLNEWLKPTRAFRLSNAGPIGQNPDQRLHADAQHLTELMTDLGIGLLQATLLLLSFIGVLWVLSQHMAAASARSLAPSARPLRRRISA